MTEAKEYFIEKREGERVRIGINEYQGKEYIDIRVFYENDAGEWSPTKKGITLPPEKLDELKDALSKLA